MVMYRNVKVDSGISYRPSYRPHVSYRIDHMCLHLQYFCRLFCNRSSDSLAPSVLAISMEFGPDLFEAPEEPQEENAQEPKGKGRGRGKRVVAGAQEGVIKAQANLESSSLSLLVLVQGARFQNTQDHAFVAWLAARRLGTTWCIKGGPGRTFRKNKRKPLMRL